MAKSERIDLPDASEDKASEEAYGSKLDRIIDDVGAGVETGDIPFDIYNDESVYDAELNRIFGESWVFIGHESEIPEPGDYRRRYIGQDPYIFTRDESGTIQVLFDCCRHRGARLSQAEQGNTSAFRCPYHGWTYRNSGELVGVPSKHSAYKCIDEMEYALQSAAKVESQAGLVFATLNPDAPSLGDYLGDFRFYIDMHFALTEGGMEVIGEPHRFIVDNNWKIAAENAAGDAYHTKIVHRTMDEVGFSASKVFTDPDWYYIVDIDRHNALVNISDSAEDKIYWGLPTDLVEDNLNGDLSDEQLELARRSESYVCNVFPNLTFSRHIVNRAPTDQDESISYMDIRLWHPIGPDKMELWTWFLAPKEASDEFKEEAQKGSVAWNGPAGNGEQDDTVVWEGITKNAGGVTTEKTDFKIDYRMGMEEMSEVKEIADFPGPGTAIETLTEEQHRVFQRNWYEFMKDGEHPDLLQ